MAKNIKSLQLLRNGNVFNSYAAAVAGITDTPTDDGVIKLARYTYTPYAEGSGDTKYVTTTVKTVFGICHNPNNVTSGTEGYTYTIFDSYHEVIEDLQSQIDSITGGEGSIARQIEAALDRLDFSGLTGNVVTGVEQTNGKVSATGANVGTLALTGYDEGTASGKVEASDSINAAIAKLQNQIDAANEAKDKAIADLDYTDTAVTGDYVSAVDETDGVISVTRVPLPSVNAISEAGKPITAVSESLGAISATAGTINAEYVNVADADNNFTASTVEAVLAEIKNGYTAADAAIVGGASDSANTLGKLEGIVNDLNADAATYTIRKDDTGLPAGVKERYTLVETKNGTSTDKAVAIDIPKDSHIVSIEYISDSGDTYYQNLKYTYLDASGATQTVYVDMANLVFESEFKSGVTATDGIVHGVVDPTSETFLTVGANGLKLDGVTDAINAAINALDVSDSAVTGQYVSAVNETDGKVTISRANVSDAVLNDYTKGTAPASTAIVATDDVKGALAKLEHQVDKAKAAATTKVVEGTDAGNNMTITSATSETDGSVTYTVNLTDVASKSALDAEIAARKAVDGQTGSTYAANASSNFINSANSLNDADVKLDTELKKVEDEIGLVNSEYQAPSSGYASGASTVSQAIAQLNEQAMKNTIKAGDGITITEATDGTTVAVKLRDITDNVENPLKFSNDGELYFDVIDAGTY